MLASAYTQRFFYDATDPGLEQKAFLEIEKALAINPDQAEAYLARAQTSGTSATASSTSVPSADLQRAVANNPSLAEAHVELGKVYYHIGLLDKADRGERRSAATRSAGHGRRAATVGRAVRRPPVRRGPRSTGAQPAMAGAVLAR